MSGEDVLAITGGRVVTASGPVYDPGTVLVRQGRIAAVGPADDPALAVPEGARRIDARGRWVTPGFVDAHNHAGLHEEANGPAGSDGNELTDPVTPQLRALDAVNPEDEGLRDALRGGVTTLWLTPGSGNAIGGQGSTFHAFGRTVEEMLLREFSGLKLALGENPKRVYGEQKRMPSTRMGTAFVIREAFVRAREYMEKLERAQDDPERRPPRDLKLEALARVLRGEVPVRNHCHRADDIRTALRLADEFGYRLVIDHGTESHKLADELARRGVPVAWGPATTSRSKVELRDRTLRTPKLLAEAGVRFAIMTDHPVIPVWLLRITAGLAVGEGLDEEAAFRALTVVPAEITGVADRVGSLEPGKLADIVLWDGHPFEVRTRPEQVLIEGRVVWSREG
ncbi:MAG: amidohydrolase [Clostridia bacterium]|nr:amidohydrolase [Clostridia bacterium]MCL6522929.1 amidohydrolase [Bacillota bacterium]